MIEIWTIEGGQKNVLQQEYQKKYSMCINKTQNKTKTGQWRLLSYSNQQSLAKFEES